MPPICRYLPRIQPLAGLCLMLMAIAPTVHAAEPGALIRFPTHLDLPQVLTGADNRSLIGPGDAFLADGLEGRDARRYHLLRPDPGAIEGTARVLGDAIVIETTHPAVLRVQRAQREIRPGDYLLADPTAAPLNDE